MRHLVDVAQVHASHFVHRAPFTFDSDKADGPEEPISVMLLQRSGETPTTGLERVGQHSFVECRMENAAAVPAQQYLDRVILAQPVRRAQGGEQRGLLHQWYPKNPVLLDWAEESDPVV